MLPQKGFEFDSHMELVTVLCSNLFSLNDYIRTYLLEPESSASRNWTSGAGHFVNDQQRAEGIKTTGREMYYQMLSRFVQFRDANRVEGDIFDTYKAEGLLNKFRSG